jgi:hypothetical protein
MGYGCKYSVAGQNSLTDSPLTHTHQYSYTVAQHCTAGSEKFWQQCVVRKDGTLRPYAFTAVIAKIEPIAYTPTQCVLKLGPRFFVLGLSDHSL